MATPREAASLSLLLTLPSVQQKKNIYKFYYRIKYRGKKKRPFRLVVFYVFHTLLTSAAAAQLMNRLMTQVAWPRLLEYLGAEYMVLRLPVRL